MRGRKPIARRVRRPAAPSCPRELTAEERREWKRLTAELREAEILTRADRALLLLWCQTWTLREKARAEVQKIGGEVVRGPAGGAELNKWYSIARHAEQTLLRIASELGLSPTSRTRLDYELPDAEDLDALLRDVDLADAAEPVSAGRQVRREAEADVYEFRCVRCQHEALVFVPFAEQGTRCPQCHAPAHVGRDADGRLELQMEAA
jgi:P27 family predicted phage terminase small subunit